MNSGTKKKKDSHLITNPTELSSSPSSISPSESSEMTGWSSTPKKRQLRPEMYFATKIKKAPANSRNAVVVMSTITKRKYKRSDIEAYYRNETKTFWCVPKKEVERFYLVQKLGNEIITFLFVPEPFKSKSWRFYVVYKLWNKTKTFWCVPKFLKQKQNFSM